MKFLIQWILILITALNPLIATAALTDYDRQEINFKNWLAPYNSGFESGVAKWTASGGTFAAVTSGSNLLTGKGSATWDSSSASQTLSSQTITIEKGYYGQNCEAALRIQTPSGTATHTLQAYDGTNILVSSTVISSTLPGLNTLNFPCPSSGTVLLRLVSVASDEPLVAIDDAYLGLARNVGSTQLISEWTSWTPTGSWTTNTTYTGKWRRVGDQYEFRIRLALGGAPTATGLTVNFLSSACSAVDTSKNNGTTAPKYIGYGSIRSAGSDSAAIVAYTSGTAATIIVPNTASTYIASSTAVSNTLPATFTSGDAVEITGSVPCVAWAASTIVMPDAQGWFASASITGANANITGSSSAWQETTNASLTMVQNQGSATVGIPCATGTTNSQGALTCASANESFGIDVSVPRSGYYEVCAQGAVGFNDSGGGTNFSAEITFAVIQTTAASSTPVVEGPGRSNAKYGSASAGGGEVLAVHYPFNTCSTFSLSAGRNTFRLENENSVSGTGSIAMMADGDAAIGAKSVTFTVKPVSQQQQAILANSVSTGTTNGEKIGRATIANSGTASITSQSTGFLSSVSRASIGLVDLVFATGYFSAAPSCTCTGRLGGRLCAIDNTSPPSTTGGRFWTGLANTAAEADIEFQVICVGPR